METKLTLRIDDRLIARAKRRARASGRSLSRLVADVLSALETSRAPGPLEPTPRTSALRGSLRPDGEGGTGGRP